MPCPLPTALRPKLVLARASRHLCRGVPVDEPAANDLIHGDLHRSFVLDPDVYRPVGLAHTLPVRAVPDVAL